MRGEKEVWRVCEWVNVTARGILWLVIAISVVILTYVGMYFVLSTGLTLGMWLVRMGLEFVGAATA